LDNFINNSSDFSGTAYHSLMKGHTKYCACCDAQHRTSVLSTSKTPKLNKSR